MHPAGDRKLSQLGEKLCDNIGVFFEDVAGQIKPSVLHGDLWSGNIAGVQGQPAIFDPATYYGHHEAEFGMSWCAGELACVKLAGSCIGDVQVNVRCGCVAICVLGDVGGKEGGECHLVLVLQLGSCCAVELVSVGWPLLILPLRLRCCLCCGRLHRGVLACLP